MEPKTVEEFLAALQAVIDGAEGRSLTDEEVARYEELEKGLQRAQKTDELQKRQSAYNAPNTSLLVTGAKPKDDDALDRAFDHYMRTGKENADIAELRAQGTGDSAGGYTVPTGFRNKLIERMKAFGGIANAVEEITTDTGEELHYPTLDDTANDGEIAAEGAAGANGADLVFGEVVLGAYKYVAPGADNTGSDPLRVSVELLQDSAFDVQGLVARKLGERIARKQAVDWVNGTGSGQPDGITTSTGASVVVAGAAPTYDDLLDMVHSVDPAYRAAAKWGFNDGTLRIVRGLVDGNNRPLWLPEAQSGMEGLPGGTLLGFPVVIDQAFADYDDAGTGGNKWGVFGDLTEGYIIRRVKAVTLIVDPYTRASQGQVCYTVWARADGTVQNPNAFSVLKNDTIAA